MIKKIIILVFSIIFLTGCSSKNFNETITLASWGSITEVTIINKIKVFGD